MTVLERFYTSSGKEVIHETLQVDVGDAVYYLTKGWEDITATTEAGSVLTFTACGISVAKPARNADGTQDLKFALSNIKGEVSEALRVALIEKRKMFLTSRSYLSTDLSAPAERSYKLKVKSGQWSSVQAQLTAGYMNILDTAWPRDRYTLNKHPGLRYI